MEFPLYIFDKEDVLSVFSVSNEELIASFGKMASREDVANLLEIPDRRLRYILYAKKPENQYTSFEISKKRGGTRTINAPSQPLKSLQRKLNYIFQLIYERKHCVHGFTENRNILTNARAHQGKKVILNIDLKDFFPSINFGRVRGMLIAKPYSLGEEAATVISQLACLNGLLPQGAPSSPVLTNMICRPLDNKLIRFAKANHITYSRYADDITFSSSQRNFPSNVVTIDSNGILHLGEQLTDIISKSGFEINFEKVYLRRKSSRQEVTGLVINEYPNIPRPYLKSIRAIIHNCKTGNLFDEACRYFQQTKGIDLRGNNENDVCNRFKRVIHGHIRYIGYIKRYDSDYFLQLIQEASEAFGNDFFDVDSLKKQIAQKYGNLVVIENIDQESEHPQGTGFYLSGIGLVSCMHVLNEKSSLGIYKVFQYHNYPDTKYGSLIDAKKAVSDYDIDYAIYQHDISCVNPFQIGNAKNLKIGDTVTVLGYPDFGKGDTPYRQEGYITGIKNNYHGACLYLVSARINHGISGGPVLNTNGQVIGIIKGGIKNSESDEHSTAQGFVPIHLVLEDYKKKMATL